MKIYFTASTSHNGELIPYYKKILEYILKHKVTVLSGFQVANKNVLSEDKKLTAAEIYNRETNLIDQADFIIAEVSKPSIGVGSEIVYALNENKPVLAMVRTDFEDKISPILLGNPSENLHLEYYRSQDYTKIIDKFIKNMDILIRHKNILKKNKGKLIVIDGGDGSGKTTQVALLYQYLKDQHIPVKIFDFPRYYNSFHGNTVARFLRGEFGTIDQVSPYLASLAYALDRASVKKEMDDVLDKGGLIIANRYTTSNMAHQGSKFKDENEKKKFLLWIMEMEYKVHKIPKEDLIIYLYVPWKIGIKLTALKENRDYLKGKQQDIHEKNFQYRKAVEKMYLELADMFKNWVKIDCFENGRIENPQIIHQKIINILKQKGILD